jgi:hypothetical protein
MAELQTAKKKKKKKFVNTSHRTALFVLNTLHSVIQETYNIVCVCVYVCTYVNMYVCMYVCKYAYMYECTYVCTM